MNKRYETLLRDCYKIKSGYNRKAVDLILDSAAINATDTIRDEHLPLADWDRHFVGTLEGILSEAGHNRYVVKFFAARGITA